MDKPQIVIHSQKPLDYTSFDVKWIPQSPKFLTLGQMANGTGVIEIHSLNGSIQKINKPNAFKCGTFGATENKTFVTGDFSGRITEWDLERCTTVSSFVGHDQIINAVDGCGGQSFGCGPPELVTASRDGTVKIWDLRQGNTPAAILAPAEGEPIIDPWTVSFGNSFSDRDRVVAAGYENGDVKIFDLKTMSMMYETNLKNGVCHLEFDRRDIKMNKLVVTGLESKFHVMDLRTKHLKKGFATLTHKQNASNTTGWAVKHLPQNRDIFMTSTGAGILELFKYHYPPKRSSKDENNEEVGVVGCVKSIQTATLAEQPIGAFDWSPDKSGLFSFISFDQQVRIGMVTKISTL